MFNEFMNVDPQLLGGFKKVDVVIGVEAFFPTFKIEISPAIYCYDTMHTRKHSLRH